MSREEIRAALTDRQALIATLWGEARGETLEARVAVACVIRNRVTTDLKGDGKRDWWGESFAEVCLAPAQFSCWSEDNTNTAGTFALAEALVTRAAPADAALIRELGWIADGVMSGVLRDITRGATHYVTRALMSVAPPAWARGRNDGLGIGAHLFFAGVER